MAGILGGWGEQRGPGELEARGSFASPMAGGGMPGGGSLMPAMERSITFDRGVDPFIGGSTLPRQLGENDEQNDVYVPLDPCRLFETTNDLDARLADHCKFEQRATNKPLEHVTMERVQEKMDELKTEKEQDESIKDEIKKALENLTKKTVTPEANSRDRPLTAARICQIENRLQTDPTLRFDDEADGGNGGTEEAARLVKRSLIRTYGKIKKSSHDLSQVALHQLENRIQILKKV
eukprot:CAMPEP_0171202780 /NCGR_PEP_ID=MMETSP0790-20130122/25180_1 /TAXON_ID=2925 /ORGANISM="Alexandrium catenella, Strain OF101" /LENGTH=235 /DNA_ID=CAMNT_0011668217 /DNA_START=65 /DNA_END=772 /DNA_ORIENTATION=+